MFALDLTEAAGKDKSRSRALTPKELRELDLGLKGPQSSRSISRRPESYREALSIIESAISDIKVAEQE